MTDRPMTLEDVIADLKRMSEIAARMRLQAEYAKKQAIGSPRRRDFTCYEVLKWADEIDALIEEGGDATRESGGSREPDGIPVTRGARTGPALTQAQRDFFEAAKRVAEYVNRSFPNPDDRHGAQEGDLLVFAQVDAYRAMLAEEETPK